MIFANFDGSNHLAHKSQITNIIIYCAQTAKNIKKNFLTSHHVYSGSEHMRHVAADSISPECNVKGTSASKEDCYKCQVDV